MKKLELEGRLNIPLSEKDLMNLELLASRLQKNKTDRSTNRITKASLIRALIAMLVSNKDVISTLQVKDEKELINYFIKHSVLK